MTPDELVGIISRGQSVGLVEAAGSMDETERRKLSKTAAHIHREIERDRTDSTDSAGKSTLWARIKHAVLNSHKRGEDATPQRAARLAVLAFCSLSDAKKVKGVLDSPHGLYVRVLVDRKPAWADAWLESQYTRQFGQPDWDLLRELVRRGVCSTPKVDGYLQQLALELGRPWGQRERGTIRSRLLAEPDLLEDVWRFFDVEVDGFSEDQSDWAARQGEPYESWMEATRKLSTDGHLDRQRLLDGCLSGMHRDFKNKAITGYIRLFEALEPTDEELSQRQQTLLDLLSVRATHVVTFALKMLKRLNKARTLDGEAFLKGVAVVFSVRTKSQPKTALTLISQVCRRQPELIPWAVGPVLDAVAHEVADVQEKAVDILEGWTPRLHADHAATLHDRLDDLAPTLRPRVEVILQGMGADVETVAEEDVVDTADVDELMERAANLNPQWREIAMVPAAIDAIENGTMPGPLELDILQIPLLSALEPIRPIEAVDELIDAVSHAIEELESADELERILDAISRLGGERSDDFEQRTAPLVKRIEDLHVGQSPHSILGGWGTIYAVRRLLLFWFRHEVPRRGKYEEELIGISPLVHRLREIFDRLADQQTGELLAAPTHPHGWIEPTVLVQRLSRWQESGQEFRSHDFVQALLRLAPDSRAKALNDAGRINGVPGRVLRWALGGDEGPTRRDRDERFLWLAAGRARDPVGHLTDLKILKLGDDPDAVVPAQYEWRCFRTKHEPHASWAREYQTDELEIIVRPGRSRDSAEELAITVQLHPTEPRYYYTFGSTAWQIQHAASIWPLNLQPAFARAIHALKMRLDSPTSTFDPNHEHFSPLFEPDRPWPELAYLAVCLGMLTKDAESRTAALDAMIEAMADGRVHPEPLGRLLVKVVAGGWVKMNRLADSLREIARFSPLHAWTAARLATDVVASFEELPRDAHHLLTLLLELLTESGLELDESARIPLASVKGASKTAKAAKALLARKGVENSPRMRRAAIQTLEARLDRAERWAGSQTE